MPQALVEKLRREAGSLAVRLYEGAYRSALERYKDPARAARIAIAAVKRHFYQDERGRWRAGDTAPPAGKGATKPIARAQRI